MPSFDIVSEVDMQEVRNAVENAQRELETRFDFRGVEAKFEWTKDETKLTAEADFQLQQMLDILRNKLLKRNVDVDTMDVGEVVHSGKTYSIAVKFKQGIDQEVAKKLSKLIKDSKLKVQPSIQGDQVRVSGKSRDELQATIALVREAKLGQPFQFTNFRD
ncbi:YajQ family cyclic di-GMP-binding protein [Saccharophagus sp. K07]|uniref:YajQ family cyclic di-GMP-binding protein n=1 Tax=Saccharophagus sp. K07 TaxID=2283636 RepID=UPI001651B834|nr:YajQ family cyclic di-GMP-binding protein [Saccharophagus sp. K07]MBC6907231.1 YajQ family cyclic di-GMP-binding protein [Saccharophagus sp. K07]